MLRILAPFAIGILAAIIFPAKSITPYLFSSLFIVLLIVWNWRFNKNGDFNARWIFGMLTALFFAFSGYSLTMLRQPDNSKYYYSGYLQRGSDTLLATIVSQPTEKEKTIKTTAEINAVFVNGKSVRTSGKALLYFEKDSLAQLIKYGDVLFIHTALQLVKPPSNPDEFNYKRYLYLHGINREAFLRSNVWRFSGSNNASPLLDFASHCRRKLITLLKEKIGGTEATLASAILLGYRNDLPQPLIQQFAESGVIHVICVAGLHVGILFGLIAWILSPLEKFRAGRFIRLLLILLLLWCYAIFTGLATPVVRATVMFSFIFIGQYFGRYSNSLNNLAASALLLLLCNPLYLADTGFQLSYLSVAGIIILYPMFYRLLELQNYFTDKIWELICLSLSAQLAIAPLSIFYFNQFPNYFIFTNLLIVPLLAVAICAGVLFFATWFIPFVSNITALILQKNLLLMNYVVRSMHHLPFFATKGIAITVPESLLLYGILLALLVFVVSKKKSLMFIAMSGMVIFTFGRVGRSYLLNSQQIFTVYNIPGHSAVAFMSGKQAVMVQPVDSLNFCMHIQSNWCMHGIEDSLGSGNIDGSVLLSNHLYCQGNYVQFNNLKVALIRCKEDVPHAIQKLKMNYLVVSGGYKMDIVTLANAFIFDRLIFDSSVSSYRLKKWEDQCEQLHIRYYDVAAKGAFIESAKS